MECEINEMKWNESKFVHLFYWVYWDHRSDWDIGLYDTLFVMSISGMIAKQLRYATSTCVTSSAVMEPGLSHRKDFCELTYLGHAVKFPTHTSLIMIRYRQQRLYMKMYGQLVIMVYDWDRLCSVWEELNPKTELWSKHDNRALPVVNWV